MNKFERLLAESEKDNIIVIEKYFKSKALGLCKGNKIGLSKKLTTIAEKACIYAEEYHGHFKTTVGNITDLKDIRNAKQEVIAHAKAIERLCSISHIVAAIKSGANDRYEIAEYLTITDSFFDESIQYHKRKHGIYYECDDIILYFNNGLGIIRKDIN
ncbi:hypothetical protein [Clostridium sp. M14]|uniref:hypothetical protein n=1 Tax=Clostridium sp. M14 TaxID=2716311 RepID=UPI0013EE6291|nr:hypothetical protein [Clostridium sp. M14]MBZ9690853.1 hypothetical protein [Clostridium sp. M14]